MALGALFRRRVSQLVRGHADSPATRARVAAYARESLAELVAAGRASPVSTVFVDGRAGAAEETVKLNGGSIIYLFSQIAQAAAFALTEATNRSPVKSGAYRDGWFVAVGGQPWTAPFAEIPPGSVVTLTNAQPYHRKIDTGGMITSVPPGIVEATRQAVQRQFRGLTVEVAFVTLPNSYVLKGRGRESGLTFSAKQGWGRKHKPRPARAKDRQVGQVLTYPAVVISERAR